MFVIAIILIIIISVGMSLLSLKSMKKHLKTEEVSKELAKGRVIFQAPSSSESS